MFKTLIYINTFIILMASIKFTLVMQVIIQIASLILVLNTINYRVKKNYNGSYRAFLKDTFSRKMASLKESNVKNDTNSNNNTNDNDGNN